MADRSRFDQNNRNSLIAVSNADGETPVSLWADPATHTLLTSAAVTLSGTSDVNLKQVGGVAFSLGQQLAAASLPIVLTATQISTLTPPAAITNYAQETGGNLATLAGTVAASVLQANVKQVGGTATDTNSGTKSAGTQRIVIATDQPQLTNALKVDGSAVTQPISGTVTSNIGTTNGLALDATLTGGTQQTKLTDGTNIANILKSDGTVAGQNAQLTAPAVQTLTFTTSTPGAQTLLANTDVSHYAWIEIVYTSVGSGLALTGQFSTASGGAYVNQSTFSVSGGSPNAALGAASGTVYTSPVRGNFFQIAVSALTSGTFAGTVTLRAVAPTVTGVTALSSQSGTWTVGANSATGSAVPANAFYQGISDGTNLRGVLGAANALNSTGTGLPTAQIIGQFDDTSPTSITENQFGNLRMSANRNLYGTIRDAAGNERGANVTAANALVVDGSAVTQPTQGGKTNNNAAPGATNMGSLTGLANAAVPAWTEGNQVLASMDLSGNQRVTLGTALSQTIDSILTYPFGHSYAHISTSTTTTVKSGAGILHNISVNTLGTVASTTTVYDNTAGSGTVIAVINTLALSGSFVLDVAFSTGLTVVTTGTVAPDITVSYR